MQNGKIKIVKRHSGELIVTLPYNSVYIEKLKGIKGHRWEPEQKCWIFPDSEETIKRLLEIFKDENVWIDPSLQQVVGQTFRFAKSHKNGSRKLQLAHITLFEDLRREMVSRK